MRISQIENVLTGTLRGHPRNARTHPKKQIRQLARSIQQFGFTVPIIIDEDHIILAGHARWLAAQEIGLSRVPVLVLSGLSEAHRRAYLLADNKLSEKAGWDKPKLAVELSSLAPLLIEAGLDISLTGFEAAEIDTMLADYVDPEVDPADVPPPIATRPVSRTGELWQLGEHRLLCGDAREAPNFRELMAGDQAAMVFADPPYNVSVRSIQGRGKIKHGEFAMASGEMSKAQFTSFLADTTGLAARHSADGSIHFICMDWRHLEEMIEAGKAVYSRLENLVVWNKTNAGQGSFYRSKHELGLCFQDW